MKRIQRLIVTFILTLALAFSAVAGDMPGPGNTPTPPASTATEGMPDGVSATGDMPGPGAVTLDPLTEFTLNLLQSVLSLF